MRIGGKTIYSLLKTDPLPCPAESLPEIPATPDGRRAWEELRIEARYDGYLQREEAAIARLNKLESWKIPADFDYDQLRSLRNESRLKLQKVRPTTLAQAERIDGVTPAEIALLQVHLTRLHAGNPPAEAE